MINQAFSISKVREVAFIPRVNSSQGIIPGFDQTMSSNQLVWCSDVVDVQSRIAVLTGAVMHQFCSVFLSTLSIMFPPPLWSDQSLPFGTSFYPAFSYQYLQVPWGSRVSELNLPSATHPGSLLPASAAPKFPWSSFHQVGR